MFILCLLLMSFRGLAVGSRAPLGVGMGCLLSHHLTDKEMVVKKAQGSVRKGQSWDETQGWLPQSKHLEQALFITLSLPILPIPPPKCPLSHGNRGESIGSRLPGCFLILHSCPVVGLAVASVQYLWQVPLEVGKWAPPDALSSMTTIISREL